MKLTLDMGTYRINFANKSYDCGSIKGMCPECGKDIGTQTPYLNLNEKLAFVYVECPACGFVIELFKAYKDVSQCVPESSPADISQDF